VHKGILILALFGCLPTCGANESERGRGPQAIPVKTQIVATTERTATMEAFGTLLAVESVEVRAETSGQVVGIAFADGAEVKRGAVLVRLRATEAEARLREARAQSHLAKTNLERAQKLHEFEHLSTAEMDRLGAEVETTESRQSLAEEALRKMTIRAPFHGVLGLRQVAVGDVIDPSVVITRLDDINPLEVDLALPERLSSRLETGLPLVLEVEAIPDETFNGSLSFVSSSIEPATRTITVRANIDNSAGRLKPGMSVRATLTLETPSQTIAVPAEAVMTRSDGAVVWVVANDMATSRTVRMGERLDDAVLVLSGLEPGDELIVEGLVRVREGAKVRRVDRQPQVP
jgi:membrane fusion protein, multidrug efflux system